jgi:hypothetical protein
LPKNTGRNRSLAPDRALITLLLSQTSFIIPDLPLVSNLFSSRRTYPSHAQRTETRGRLDNPASMGHHSVIDLPVKQDPIA